MIKSLFPHKSFQDKRDAARTAAQEPTSPLDNGNTDSDSTVENKADQPTAELKTGQPAEEQPNATAAERRKDGVSEDSPTRDEIRETLRQLASSVKYAHFKLALPRPREELASTVKAEESEPAESCATDATASVSAAPVDEPSDEKLVVEVTPLAAAAADTAEPSTTVAAATGFNQLTTANLMSDSKVLAQKKKQFFLNELAKCPHEDHTYAISSNSIAMALQSSNIFNQNNTRENLASFLGQVKDIQMNPKLQKILGKVIEESTASTAPRAVCHDNGHDDDDDDGFSNLVSGGGEDTRDCFTCRLEGDDAVCGRLLPFDSYWIHVNCLLWSEEVGVLAGSETPRLVDPIESVLVRMRSKCVVCEREGATVRCSERTCGRAYHFKCAHADKCVIVNNLGRSEEATAATRDR